jgi:two-component sensor histidine kinase
VHLRWQESGGPALAVDDGAALGFGSRLVDLAVTGQLQGRWERSFEADGLIVHLDLPAEVLAA